MMKAWRPLALAAALYVTAGVGVATAQTVMVRNAPPGSTIELGLNAATLGSTTVGANGIATLAMDLAANVGKTETDVSLYVDTCDTLRRVLVVERASQPPPPGAGCDRRQIVGLFMVRRVSTLVVDVSGPNPTVLLRQGSYNPRPPRDYSDLPTGFVLFGGGGMATFSNARAVACGGVSPCEGSARKWTYTAGGEFWLNRFIAAEISYFKPAKFSVIGSDEGFRFETSLETDVLTLAGKVGIPVGLARLYGKAGGTYHQATSFTTETTDPITITVDGVEQTIEGGTQTFELRTEGWGWLFGGGAEFWVKPSIAIYGELGRASLQGDSVEDEEGSLDERVTYFLGGVRIRIGG